MGEFKSSFFPLNFIYFELCKMRIYCGNKNKTMPSASLHSFETRMFEKNCQKNLSLYKRMICDGQINK